MIAYKPSYPDYGDTSPRADLQSIRNFLSDYRHAERIFIPQEKLPTLKAIFASTLGIDLELSSTNPLSTMETIVLALSFFIGTKEIAYIVMSTSATIETYIKRIKFKLAVKAKTAALYKAIQLGYLRVLGG